MGNEESRFLKEGQVGLYSTKDILIFTFDDWTKLWGRLREDAVLELYANKVTIRIKN
jgi:hypothetical protein